MPASLRGWGGGVNICCVHSVQDSAVIVKHWGEMHPPRGSVLMCLACSEVSLSATLQRRRPRWVHVMERTEKLLQC